MLRSLTPPEAPELLIGAADGDDAAVWRLDDDRALVVTADFITPVVDDARTWGRIAAANAVSDVYAMGAKPLLALNLVAWNTAELSRDLLAEVLAGGDDAARADGFVVAGGHTIDDPEPKYGMAVVGEVDPSRMLTSAGVHPGDRLILSKPLGIGVIATAIKQGSAPEATVDRATETMIQSNREAALVALGAGAAGATDVTGFGLLGHAALLARASGVDLEIDVGAVPVIDGARDLAEAGFVPGGTDRNRDWVSERLDGAAADDTTITLLADAQTSGGLLFGVDAGEAQAAVDALRSSSHDAASIGRARPGTGLIRLLSN